MRRTVYVGSLLAVGALLDEFAFFVLSRHPVHLADHGVRLRDNARARLKF